MHKRKKVGGIAEHQGFHLFSEIDFILFWFSRYWRHVRQPNMDQNVQKKFLHILQCHLFSLHLALQKYSAY